MRIPRLLEVLGRLARPEDQRNRAAAGGHPAAGKPYMPAPLESGAKPKLYVEEVKVQTGRFDALDPGPVGFQGARPTQGRPPAAAPAPAPAGGDTAGRRSADRQRERIAVSSEIEAGGTPLRRPPAGRR